MTAISPETFSYGQPGCLNTLERIRHPIVASRLPKWHANLNVDGLPYSLGEGRGGL